LIFYKDISLLTPDTIKPAPCQNTFDEKLLRLLISRIQDYAIFMLDPNGYILSWNKGAENIKGYTEEEIIGKHISVFYTEEDRRKHEPRHNLNEALKNNMHESEGWRVRKDGTFFWANVVFTTLYDDKGHLTGFAKITRDVTARKKNDVQKALLNTELERRVKANTEKIITHERRFRKLIENSNDGISLFDGDLNIIYRSRAAVRINGWSDEERSVQNMADLTHPDDLLAVEAIFCDILANPGTPKTALYRTLHKRGHYIWIECLFNNMLDDPDIAAIVCNFRDVTGRVLAEEQIRDKNKQIENILDSITDGFIALDKNFCYTHANRKIGQMLGLSPELLIGWNVWEVFPDAMGSSTYNAFNEAMQQQRYICNEDYYEALGLWQENHIYPSDKGLSVFIRDITERKLAEASLVQSESNLRSVFENTDLAIILFDSKANIISYNNNAANLAAVHLKCDLQAGVSALEYCLPERRPQIGKILNRVKHESVITYEVSYPMPEQLTIWFEVRWVNVVNDDKRSIGTILTLKDITEKKLADIERDRITKDLIQRNKDLEQFTYIVSHNLRAPVANIQGLSNLLSDMQPASAEEDAEALQALATSVNSLDKVIRDLNNILQVSNAANDTLEVVSLPLLVDEVVTVNRELIEKNRAKIDCNFRNAEDLKSLKSYLYSILQNLMVNSIKYRKADTDPIITITSERRNDKICINYKDNGKGIDLERYGKHLFGLYKRFDLSVEGKGMGLFMVKMQTERLGGKVNIQSNVGEGTTFKLEFPEQR